MPLFPGYLFACIPLQERVRVLEVRGVHSIVAGVGGKPAILPDREMSLLRQGLHFYRREPHPWLCSGQSVRILRGPLAGLEGIVARVKGQMRVVLTLELIMRSIAIEIDAEDLMPLGESWPLASGNAAS